MTTWSGASRWYILDANGDPRGTDNDDEVVRWMHDRGDSWIVAKTKVDDAEVSTVFLMRDHNYTGYGSPILWETMIFGGAYDQWCWRYTTRLQASAHHDQVVAALRCGEAPPDLSVGAA